MKIDTLEIRSAAKRVKSCANSLSGDVKSDLQSLLGEIDPSFKGEAAEVLKKRLKDMQKDASAMQNALNTVAQALYDYADALDEADRELADMM